MELSVNAMTGGVNWFQNGFSLPLGHVTYVLDSRRLESLSGRDWEFFLSPLADPLYITLIAVTLIAAVGGFAVCELVGPLRCFCRSIHDRLLVHVEYVPLVLRTTLGFALIASGVGNGIYLPNVPAGGLGGLEVGIGFCLILGFMVRASGVAALVIFVYGLTTSHYMLGTLESAVAALLVAAHGPRLPCADQVLDVDLLGESLESVWSRIRQMTPIILRMALGTTLIWLAITEKFLNPRLAEAVIVEYDLHTVIPVSTAMWVFAVGVIEVAVGVVLVVGLYTRCFSLIALIILTLSFFYFKEDVAGHVTFFGSLIVLLFSGAGHWSIDSLIAKLTRNVKGTAVPHAL